MDTTMYIVFIIFAFLIAGFVLLVDKKKNTIIKCTHLSVVLIMFGIIFIFLTIGMYGESKKTKNSNESNAGFDINSYNVKLNVNENNTINVTETITVYFYDDSKHGIYKFVPMWLEYTPKDGKTISRKSKVENLKAVDEEYTTDIYKGKKRIKIGTANKTIPVGTKTYTITYDYIMGSDPYNNFDEFIFHSFGDHWNQAIENASLEITMPKEIDTDNIKFFSDKYREKNITNEINYYVNGNTIYASANYNLDGALTVDIVLPEGYFNNAPSNYGYYSMIICLVIIAFTIITYIKWFKYGKDYEKLPEKIEFNIPNNYDPAEIGYIYKQETGIKSVIALIVSLAGKGYLKIDEDEEKIILTNLCQTNVDQAIKRQVSVTKIADPIKTKDIELMNTIFGNNEKDATVNINFNDFYEKTKKLVSQGYLKINSDSIDKYSKDALANIKEELVAKAFIGKPELTENEELIYNYLFEKDDTYNLSESRNYYSLYVALSEKLQDKFDEKMNDIESYKNMALTGLLFLIEPIIFGLAFSFVKDMDPKYKFLYYIAIIGIIITGILVFLMKRKNKYGEELTARIKGFKSYLETAGKEQIESFTKEDSNYFYSILPYAYILDASKEWINKFESIGIPKMKVGNFDYQNIDNFDRLTDSMSSGSSSSGGGCSSCGGGCSSCGGGGSW